APDLLRRLPIDMPAVFVRRTRDLPAQDRQRARPTRTTIERSLVDAAQWALSDREARTILAAGCQQRLVLPADLLAVVRRLPRPRRGRLIRQTLHDLAGGAEALSEIDLLRLCRRAGLPEPKLQERRTDAAGKVRYLDAYWPQWQLHVEVDGAHHLEVGQWEADLRRQNDVWISGDRILRFTAFQVRHRPDEVVAQIRRALLAAGWRP
ncbi:MAG: endonuclease domain-containing protein, partial [Natronosporangium sp.]